jgi:hypothetical protein
LIVSDNPEPKIGKIEKGRQVLGVAARSTVKQQERPVTRARAFIPDAAVADIDVTLFAHSHTLSTFP